MDTKIYVNIAGYVTTGRKLATVVGDIAHVDTFHVVSADSGETVFSGRLSEPVFDQLSGSAVRIADFTAAPVGRHTLAVAGTQSDEFSVVPSVAGRKEIRITQFAKV